MSNLKHPNFNTVFAIKELQQYIKTYNKQYEWEQYQEKTVIDDILYGLGIAIDKQIYSGANGFKEFKHFLLLYLLTEMTITQIIGLLYSLKNYFS